MTEAKFGDVTVTTPGLRGAGRDSSPAAQLFRCRVDQGSGQRVRRAGQRQWIAAHRCSRPRANHFAQAPTSPIVRRSAPSRARRAAIRSTPRRCGCSVARSRLSRRSREPAIGGGFGLALVADFRVTSPEARFAANFVKIGFHPGFGLTHTLPRLIGHQNANADVPHRAPHHRRRGVRVGPCRCAGGTGQVARSGDRAGSRNRRKCATRNGLDARDACGADLPRRSRRRPISSSSSSRA